MRIKGLLRTFRSVRSQLRTGLSPEEVAPFSNHVKSIVATVESLCARNGVTPDHLPGPSRRVYRFLKELKPEQIPARQRNEKSPPPRPGFGLRNILTIENQFANRLWYQLTPLSASAESQKQFRADIEHHVSVIENICARENATPSALETPSRQTYCWLKFLADPENLVAHLSGLQRASEALKACSQNVAQPVTVHMVNMGALWRRRNYSNIILLKIHEGFVNADPGTWCSLARGSLGDLDQKRDPLIREYAQSDDFSEVLCELETFADPTGLSSQGHVHSLDESFARVNAAYFGNAMPKPKLQWNRALTGRKFGHYRPGTDTMMLSVSLDSSDVPGLAVDFVMYHELLHKKHGFIMAGGRRIVHSAAFRAEERQFAEFHEAERILRTLADAGRT